NAFLQQYFPRGWQSQHTEFRLPRLAQPGSCHLQIRIVISGMADEFPGALRDAAGNRVEQHFVEGAGDDDTEPAVGRDEAVAVYGFTNLSREATQDSEFGMPSPQPRAPQKF